MSSYWRMAQKASGHVYYKIPSFPALAKSDLFWRLLVMCIKPPGYMEVARHSIKQDDQSH